MSAIEKAFYQYYRPLCLYAMHYLGGDVDRAKDVDRSFLEARLHKRWASARRPWNICCQVP